MHPAAKKAPHNLYNTSRNLALELCSEQSANVRALNATEGYFSCQTHFHLEDVTVFSTLVTQDRRSQEGEAIYSGRSRGFAGTNALTSGIETSAKKT